MNTSPKKPRQSPSDRYPCSNPNCCGLSKAGPKRADGSIPHDPRYRGPEGHSPADLCFDCWMAQWTDEQVKAWLSVLSALEAGIVRLKHAGYTQAEIGGFLGKSQQTISRNLDNVRKQWQQSQNY